MTQSVPETDPPRKPVRWLAPEHPVDLAGDRLFQGNEAFFNRLQFVADHIVSAVSSPEQAEAIVFAVTAPWGTGKSSALHVLLDLVHQRIQALDDSIERDRVSSSLKIKDRMVFTTSTFRAHLHASVGQPARIRLAYDVLFGSTYWKRLLQDIGFSEHDSSVGPPRPIAAKTYLRKYLGGLAETAPALEEWIAHALLDYATEPSRHTTSGLKHIHLEFIDDLDRCDAQYTAEVLAALSFWADLPNLFFVVSADLEHLQNAARIATDLNERYPGEALEKFVHFQIEVPSLVATRRDVARFCLNLLPETPAQQFESIEKLRGLLDAAAKNISPSLLSPLLNAQTPRQAKRIFNRLIAEFKQLRYIEDENTKLLVVNLAWGQAYDQYIGSAISETTGRGQQEPRLHRHDWLNLGLDLAADALRSSDDAKTAEQRLSDMARSQGLDLGDCPPTMLLYLAEEPRYRLPDKDATYSQGLDRSTNDRERSAAFRFVPGQSEDVTQQIASIEQEITFALTIDKDPQKAIDLANSVFVLAQSDKLSARQAGTIGNIAVDLERVDPNVAWQLYNLAQQLNPEHANNRLNAADFLLTYADERALDAVAEHLDWLATNRPDHRPTRQTLHRVDLQIKRNENPDARLLYQLADAVATDAELGIVGHVIRMLRTLKHYDILEDMMRRRIVRSQDDPESSLGGLDVLLGVTAEALLGAPGGEAEERGVDMTRYMLGVGFIKNAQAISGFAHNLAVTFEENHPDVAGGLWRYAYELYPADPRLRRSYAGFLLEKGDPDNARAVQIGQEVTIPALMDDDICHLLSAVPAYMSTEVRWWENYVPEDRQHALPCFLPPELRQRLAGDES